VKHNLIKRNAGPAAASGLLVLLALAALEWITAGIPGSAMSTSGLMCGIALAGLMFAVIGPHAGSRWSLICSAVLRAITELAIASVIIYGLAAASVLFMPSLSQRLAQTDRITDLIIYIFLGAGLLVAARAWHRSWQQQTAATVAAMETLQTRATLALKEKALLESEMLLLRAQIEPHFLWNTLGQLQYLVTKSPEEAARMTAHLIGFLRATVPSSEGHASSLGTEVSAVRDYLEIMKIRMGERLSIRIEVPESLCDIPFAPRLLQTLIENAIKHGVEPKVGDVEVSVTAGSDPADRDNLWIEVADTGVGLQDQPSTRGTCMGLRNVRERLAQWYGDRAVLTIKSRPEGGVVVRIVIGVFEN
jgi:sensor histidine kinase YesM